MAVWLWEAGSLLGISGDEQAAADAAAAAIGESGSARVERASLALDEYLMPVYERLGIGRTGRVVGGRVVWDEIRLRMPQTRICVSVFGPYTTKN